MTPQKWQSLISLIFRKYFILGFWFGNGGVINKKVTEMCKLMKLNNVKMASDYAHILLFQKQNVYVFWTFGSFIDIEVNG